MSYIFNRLFRMRYDKFRNLRQYIWSSQGITARRRNTYLMEQMENRYLLSADAAPLALSAELLNEEVMVEQLIDAGLAEASNSQELQLVRQHDDDSSNADTSSDPHADIENLNLVDLQVAAEELEKLAAVQPKEAEGQPNAEAETEAATTVAIQHIQQLSGHQFVVIDRSVEDYRALLSTFMGDAGSDLEWHAETTSAGDVLVADWYPADESVNETLVADAELADALVDAPVARSQAERVTVVLLDAEGDGVEQLADILSAYEDIAALHVLSHGATGLLRLGTASLGSASLERYRQQLEAWGKALKSDGDILIYGCNVAQGEVGIAFVDRLAGATQADIAASDDLTGNRFIGGDWILETESGYVTQTLDLMSTEQFSFASNDPLYSGLLAADKSVTIGELNGTAAPVILAAGTDTINFTGVGSDIRITVTGKTATAPFKITAQAVNEDTGALVPNTLRTFQFADGDDATIKNIKVGRLGYKTELELQTKIDVLDTSTLASAHIAISKKGTALSSDDAYKWVKDYAVMGIDPTATDAATQLDTKSAVAVVTTGTGEIGKLSIGKALDTGNTRLIIDDIGAPIDIDRANTNYSGKIDLLYNSGASNTVLTNYVNLSAGNIIKGVDTLTGFTTASFASFTADKGDQKFDVTGLTDVTVAAGAGEDYLVGGTGSQTLVGGAGTDNYVFKDNWGADQVIEKADTKDGLTVIKGGDADTLDFSALTQAITVEFHPSVKSTEPLSTPTVPAIPVVSEVSDSDRTSTDQYGVQVFQGANVTTSTHSVKNAINVEKVVGGLGDNTYKFNNDWGQFYPDTTPALTETVNFFIDDTQSTSKKGTLDFREVTHDLIFELDSVSTTSTGTPAVTTITSSVKVTAVVEKQINIGTTAVPILKTITYTYVVNADNVANIIGGQGKNTYIIKDQDALQGKILTAKTTGSLAEGLVTGNVYVAGANIAKTDGVNILDYSQNWHS